MKVFPIFVFFSLIGVLVAQDSRTSGSSEFIPLSDERLFDDKSLSDDKHLLDVDGDLIELPPLPDLRTPSEVRRDQKQRQLEAQSSKDIAAMRLELERLNDIIEKIYSENKELRRKLTAQNKAEAKE